MKKNKGKVIKISIVLLIVLFIIFGIVTFIISKNNKENNKKSENVEKENQNSETEKIDVLAEDDFFVLYKGVEIPKKTGRVNLSEIKENLESKKQTRYNGRKYYNYEKDKYIGETVGNFSFEEDEEYKQLNFVSNVEKIAITKKYEAIPRKSTRLDTKPEKIKDFENYSIYEMESIDLDGDGKLEYIALLGSFYEGNQIENEESIAKSCIILLDSDFKQSINLIELQDGFTSMDRDSEAVKFLTLDDNIMYVDIDEDGIMEIIIDIPKIEGEEINIVKYSNGKIEGDVNIKANIYPGSDVKSIAKDTIQKYLDIYSLLDNGAEILSRDYVFDNYGENLYKSSEELEKNIQKSDEKIAIDGQEVTLYNTKINFDYFRNLFSNYISESLFDKQIMPYCKNINGTLYMAYQIGIENFYEVTNIEKVDENNVFRVEYENIEQGNKITGTLLASVGQNNLGKYILTDCVFEQ